MHVSTGALKSFAGTLPLLHPEGTLQVQDLFTISLDDFQNGFRGPGKMDGSVVNWLNGQNEALYGHLTPDGYALTETAWASSGQMSRRFEIARTIGNGNAVDNMLTATALDIAAPTDAGPAAIVPTSGDGDPAGYAAYAVLSNQVSDANIKARAGNIDSSPSFDVSIVGGIDNSSVANDTNAAIAASYGNQSANALGLESISITGDASGNAGLGALANVTGVQRIGGSRRCWWEMAGSGPWCSEARPESGCT